MRKKLKETLLKNSINSNTCSKRSEAVVHRCSTKKLLLKNSQISHETHVL